MTATPNMMPARLATAEVLVPRKPGCPTPTKRKFKTAEAADVALGTFWQTASRGKRMPCRAYLCECGRWHTTSHPRRQKGEVV